MRSIKVIALILCLVMVVPTALADSIFDSTPAENTLPLTNEPVTLSYMTIESWTPEYSLADNREIWQQIEKDTGVKIEWNVVNGNDYTTVLKSRIAGDDLPDIFWINASVNPMELFEDGQIIDHSEYISKYGPNIIEAYRNQPAIYQDIVGGDGKLYAAAAYAYVGVESVKALYYRQDWRAKFGIAEPKTLDDYYEMFKAFADKDPNGNNEKDEVPLAVKNLSELAPLATAFGLSIGADNGLQVDENGKVTYDYVKPAFKEFLEYLKKYYDAGILPKEVYGVGDSVQKALLADNRLGGYYNGVGQCDTYDKILLQAGFIDKIDLDNGFGLLVPPVAEDGISYWPAISFLTGDWRLCVSSSCKNPELAIRWIDYVWGSSAGSRYTTMGVEGLSYTLDANGNPVFTDYILNNPDGIGVHPALRTLGCFAPHISRWTAEAWKAQWAANPKASNQIEVASSIKMNVPFPQMLGTPEEKSELASIKADLETYRDEQILKFIMGLRPLDEYESYVAELEKMNLEKMLGIYQAQYDAL